jgi:ABC-2 type transport system permease protein
MSTTAMTPRDFSRPGMGRLTSVELRKATDTRAGMWLQITVALLTVAAVVLTVALGNDSDRSFPGMLGIAIQPSTLLLPVIAILLVTSEWSQRTALITFALVPQRGRVITAKVLSAVLIGIVATALCVVLSLLGTAVAGSDDPDRWNVSAVLVGQNLVYLLISMLVGIAFAAVARSSAPAIVAFFVLPIGFSLIGEIHALHGTWDWLDMTRTNDPLTGTTALSSTEWAQVGVSLLLWLVLPFAIGMWRLLRGEVRS